MPLLGQKELFEGGVIGINGRYRLKNGTIVTQPEFNFWFNNCGFNVENYGTDPQLDRAILEVQKDTKKNPPLKPKLKKTNLSLPKLPKEGA